MAQQKKWINTLFDNGDDDISLNSIEPLPKKRRSNTKLQKSHINGAGNASTSNIVHVTTAQNRLNPSNWIDNFIPQSINDLAVHSKKIDEIQSWLKHCESNRAKCVGRILLLTGPSGSGKTATIRVLAKQNRYTIHEWITPIDIELRRFNRNDFVDDDDDANTYTENQVDKFSEFLFRSSRYRSVFEQSNKKLVLIEDFPNIFLKEQQKFLEIIEQYQLYGKSPLIFIVTDTKSKKLDITYNIFNDLMREKYQINRISFNPSSSQLLKKALNRIASIMNSNDQYKQPTQEQIDGIILTAEGDIRNAMINLHFGSQKNSTSLPLEHLSIQMAGKKNTRKGNRKLQNIGCDTSVTFLHALGRVLNPKYTEADRKHFVHSPEQICDDFCTQPSTFVDLLYSNYLCHYQSIEDSLQAAETLSKCSIFMNQWQDDNLMLLSLNMAIRGIMVNNQCPKPGWIPIRSKLKAKNESQSHNISPFNRITNRVFATDFQTAYKIIKQNNNPNC